MDIKDKTNWVIAGAIVVLIIVLGWWLFTKPATKKVTENVATSTAMTTSTASVSTTTGTQPASTVAAATGEEITVVDQPAGDSVHVAEAKLSRVSWLAVRDDLRIYGAAKVTPPSGGGSVQDITIPLLRNTVAGKTYKVVVYVDSGSGVFDFKTNAFVEGLSGVFNATN